jgi:hypothetical protein
MTISASSVVTPSTTTVSVNTSGNSNVAQIQKQIQSVQQQIQKEEQSKDSATTKEQTLQLLQTEMQELQTELQQAQAKAAKHTSPGKNPEDKTADNATSVPNPTGGSQSPANQLLDVTA